MAVSYRVENQAGERVGVENHPGSGYSGRQCRLHKGVVGDVTEMESYGLGLKKGEFVRGWAQGNVACKEKMMEVTHRYVT